jgi:hypothetical protein
MCGIRLQLVKIGIRPVALTEGDGGDGTADGGERDRDRTTSRHVAGNDLYIVKDFHFISGNLQ